MAGFTITVKRTYYQEDPMGKIIGSLIIGGCVLFGAWLYASDIPTPTPDMITFDGGGYRLSAPPKGLVWVAEQDFDKRAYYVPLHPLKPGWGHYVHLNVETKVTRIWLQKEGKDDISEAIAVTRQDP